MGFSNLSIKIKLMVTLGIVSVMLVAVGLLGVNDLQRSNQSLRDIYANKLVPGSALAMAFQLTGEQRAAALRAANAGEADAADAVVSSAQSQQDQLNSLLKIFRSASMSDREQALAARFETDRATLDVAMNQALAALAKHDFKQAVKVLDGNVESDYAVVKKDVAAISQMQARIAKETFSEDEVHMKHSALIAYFAIGLGLGLSALLSTLLIRSIMRSLGTAVRVADNIAEGRLNNEIKIETHDELGRLLESLQRMDVKLTGIVREVRSSSTSVGTAAKQIAQGNDDLSQRTQEQASSLEETAASMEEMTATVKQNADNASQANQLVRG
ncbi:MAG: HAMP domain-containing protein, partial [Proteobacteria bacterium]|nr:HAMP domain-containing protein [Pseudomonadota bacterium]